MEKRAEAEELAREPTSVRDDAHVRPDDLHVDAMLLLSDDDRSPQPAVPTVLPRDPRPLSGRFGRGHWCVVWRKQKETKG